MHFIEEDAENVFDKEEDHDVNADSGDGDGADDCRLGGEEELDVDADSDDGDEADHCKLGGEKLV